MSRLRSYYYLAKPGIIYGNALTASAGFLLASSIKGRFDLSLFLAAIAGTSLVIGGACVINNYIDRGLDAKMARTKKRASVTGKISVVNAMVYASILGITGAALLALYTNFVTIAVGLVGVFFYLVMYSIFKRRSVWGTVVGSVSGATPIAAGYTAVTGKLDGGAIILFLIMVLWQMPHFYAIAIYRYSDYKKAGLPVMTVVKGYHHTALQIVGYVVAFTLAVASLSLSGYTGWSFAVIMVALGLWWLQLGLQGFKAADEERWGKRMFLRSLVVVMGLSVMTAAGALLP